ncbi:MAG: hypothetical protein KAT71_07605, partial [Gammaproteobacteria bacterium]|nr:hypothetical protein [Gammaproteobacteria bacterium]
MLYWPLILGGVAFLGATSMLVVSIITRSPAVAPTPEEIEEDAVTGPPYVRPASEEETTDGVEEISLKIDSSHSGPQSPASEPTPPLTPYEAFVALDLGHAEPPATSCCARLGIDLNLIAGGLRSAASSIADRLPTFSCHRPANPQNLALRLARMAGITITEAAALISFIYLMEEGTSIANNENYPVINLPQYFLSFFYGFLAQDFISLLPGNIKQICYKILHQYNAVEFMLIILASRIAEEAVPGTSFIFDIYAIARLAMIVRHRVGEEYENLLQKIRGTRSNTSDSVVTDKTTNPPAPDRKKIPLELYTSKPGPVVAYSALVFSSLTTWALFSYLSPTCVFGEATDTQERSILSLLPNDLPTLILTALLGGLTYTEACKKIRNGELDFIARIAPFATLLLRPGYSWINLALIFSGGVVGSVAIHATIHDDQIAQHCRTSQTQTIARALSSFNLESLKDLQNQALEYVGQNQTSARSNYKKMIYILHVLAIIDAIFLAINAISSDDPNGLTNVLMQLLTDSILYGSALATTVVAENSFSEVKNTIGNRLIHA